MSNSIVVLNNPDKTKNEHWSVNRDLFNIPSPSRILVAARPNSGKTNFIMNFLLKQNPPFKHIYLMHPDLRASGDLDTDDEDDVDEYDGVVNEYKYIDFTPLYSIPKPTSFKDEKNEKKILIIDDVDIKVLSKEDKKNLGKICSFASSHYNMTVIITAQDIFHQVIPSIIRFCNVFVVFPYPSISYNQMLFNRFGVNKKTVPSILNEMSGYGIHDSLCIDHTEMSPAKYRKNMYMKLNHIKDENN